MRAAVTMSIRRMSLGSGYRYLMSSVARADGSGHAASALTRYYAQSGTLSLPQNRGDMRYEE